MNLGSKKELAKRTFGVGKDRIVFVESRAEDIKEAITKQDIRDLINDGAILILNGYGRRKNAGKKRENRKVRKNINVRKRNYVILTRKLRRSLAEMHSSNRISKEKVTELRKKIRNKAFRSKAHMKEFMEDKKTKKVEGRKKRWEQ